ncbi:MAG: diaminopimelate epimerase [Duodenibacillus sp.]|nr:diaminopimelate epimerase [Duodenibacillus sp.]
MNKLAFTKMHGAGNDFMMLDCTQRPFALTPRQIAALGHRQFGVGFDQMLVVEASAEEGVDFKYRIFNQNGGEVEMCGNGARCFAVFVRARGLTGKAKIRCRTLRGVIAPEVMPDGRVRVDMGAPSFAPESLPFNPEGLSSLSRHDDTLWQIQAAGRSHWMSVASMGNPHAVALVGDVDAFDVEAVGAALQSHPAFPRQVNAGFLQVIDAGRARLRVYERGVGETYACGTGACAAAVCGMRRGVLGPAVEVAMRGGLLKIEWDGAGSVFLTGPAATVYEGEVDLDALAA